MIVQRVLVVRHLGIRLSDSGICGGHGRRRRVHLRPGSTAAGVIGTFERPSCRGVISPVSTDVRVFCVAIPRHSSSGRKVSCQEKGFSPDVQTEQQLYRRRFLGILPLPLNRDRHRCRSWVVRPDWANAAKSPD